IFDQRFFRSSLRHKTAITVPIGLLAIVKAENAICRFKRHGAARFCAVRRPTFRRARFFTTTSRTPRRAEIGEVAEKGSGGRRIYTMKSGKRDRLAIALHCEPAERKQAKRFTVMHTPRNSAYAVREAREIQFAGFAKAHRIPS